MPTDAPDRTAPAGGAPLLPLAVRGLALEYDGVRRIDGLDLSLAAGQLTVVMGPNGAGKSLLLRLLHGLIEPTAGEIRWGGRPLQGPGSAAIRRRQAMVFQRPVLLRRSVAANIDFVLGLPGASETRASRVERRDRRNALLDHVGLLDRARQPARLLSGGEQQRLALARALATGPEILFLDEPTASLDPASVQKIEEIVRAAHGASVRVIFVTHDVGQARRLADEVVFLHKGRLAEQTPASVFFNQPASAPAQSYLDGRLVL